MEFDELNDNADFPENTSIDYDDQEMTIDRVKECIELLPDGYRIVLSLYLLEGYDHNEIADILNISVSTSKSQYNRAKRKLKELLNELNYDTGYAG